MYAVKEGHTEVVKVLLEQDSLEILAKNKVSMHKKICLERLCGVLSVSLRHGSALVYYRDGMGVLASLTYI